MKCKFCGNEIPIGSKFCQECGKSLEEVQTEEFTASNDGHTYSDYSTEEFVVVDAQKDKSMAIVAYFTWIGFIIAMVSESKNSTLTKFHLNQALVLHIASIVAGMIPRVGGAFGVVVFVFWILSLVSACQGEMKSLPVISDIKLIK